MTDDFKRQLEAYERGELQGEDKEAFEKELEKLEHLHKLLEEEPNDLSPVDHKKERQVMRKGKWMARLQAAFTVIVLFIAFTIFSSIFTMIYYEAGLKRGQLYRDLLNYSMTITNPYGHLGHTEQDVKPYFNMTLTHDLKKRVGDEILSVGHLNVSFLLSLMGDVEEHYLGKTTQEEPVFYYMDHLEDPFMSDWDRLEKLPEGTVTSAYLSFEELLDTETVFNHFKDEELQLLWLAVDTGVEAADKDGAYSMVREPVGFPSVPIWHEDDFILDFREEKKGFLGSGVVSESYSSPDYEMGDVDVLHEQFMKTLNFLKKHERKVDQFFPHALELSKRTSYIEANGIDHYGVVITGPTEEILALKEEPFAKAIVIDEVALLNWRSFHEDQSF